MTAGVGQLVWTAERGPGPSLLAVALTLEGAMRAAQRSFNDDLRGTGLLVWKPASVDMALLTGVPDPPWEFNDGTYLTYTVRHIYVAP